MTIRVCQLITELRPAGAERCVYELATRLPPERFAVEVVGLRGGEMMDRLQMAGVTARALGVRGKLDIAKWPELLRILRRGRFDILHTHLFHADLVGRPAAIAVGLPHVVHTVHVAERRFRPWQFAWARAAAYSADRIVCVSRGVRDHHRRLTGLPPGKYTIIHNGIDIASYARDATRRAQLRQEWSLRDDDLLCAFVGRLNEQKGADVLLEAFEQAAKTKSKTCPKLHLVLAGDGPQRHFLTDSAQKSPAAGRVRILGFTNDVPGLLSAADILCQPSRWEGFCLAAAEAMAASLPVVASNVPGLNEVVTDGQTGILCKSGSTAQFAAALIRLAEDPTLRLRLGQTGRRHAMERFDVDQFVARHAELYESIC
ncbi:MAG: glycosyltransferase [Planctomycetes bacterium]|nr:glycosyltransferase [Planctomycetota bacterium]